MKDALYYDGKCPLCSKEMRLLSRLKDCDLELLDIHQLSKKNLEHTPGREEMLRILHLQKANGDWLSGLDANVAAWRHTKLGWIFRPLRWPGISRLADRFYYWWADRRYCSLEY